MRNGTKKKIYIFFVVCLLWGAAAAGCGTTEDAVREGAVSEHTLADWQQGFRRESLGDGEQLYVLDYREVSHEHPDDNNLPRLHVVRADGDDYLDLCRYYLDERTVYYLETIPMGEGEADSVKLHPKDWGIEGNEIWGFDAIGGEYYFLAGACDGEAAWQADAPTQCYVVTTDKKGRLKSQVDILPGLKELGFGGGFKGLYRDGAGYFYVTVMEENQDGLYIVDDEGNAVTAYICQDSSRDMIYEPVRDAAGRMFFPIKDSDVNGTRLVWKNERNEIVELGRTENEIIDKWYGMQGSELYYAWKGSVVRWNVGTGKRERVFDLKANGIGEQLSTMLFWNSSGNAYLRYISKTEDWVSRLSYEEPKLRNPVRVGIMTQESGANFVEASIATFSRKNPQCPVTVEKTSQTDNSKERMLVEVLNGKGPDLLYIPYKDLRKLWENGALAEMGELIPDSVKDTLLPGVLEYGEMGGKLYGIPISVDVKTMFTHREIWNEEGWTLDDVLELADSRQNICGIFTRGFGSNIDYYDVLPLLVEYDLAQRKSKFVDWEEGISRFEEKDFMRLLEVVRDYDERWAGKETYEKYGITTKSVLALSRGMAGAEGFFYLSSELGSDCYPVGLPAEDRRGTYLIAEGLLAVNADVDEDKMEVIEGLIGYFLSMDCQKKLHNDISVIDGIVDTQVWYNEPEKKYYWLDGSDDWIVLRQKEDGTTYTEEYKELLRSAVPYKDYCPIYDIVAEEAGAFWSGQKNALEVTRLIDRRVQLYLDENKLGN